MTIPDAKNILADAETSVRLDKVIPQNEKGLAGHRKTVKYTPESMKRNNFEQNLKKVLRDGLIRKRSITKLEQHEMTTTTIKYLIENTDQNTFRNAA